MRIDECGTFILLEHALHNHGQVAGIEPLKQALSGGLLRHGAARKPQCVLDGPGLAGAPTIASPDRWLASRATSASDKIAASE